MELSASCTSDAVAQQGILTACTGALCNQAHVGWLSGLSSGRAVQHVKPPISCMCCSHALVLQEDADRLLAQGQVAAAYVAA